MFLLSCGCWHSTARTACTAAFTAIAVVCAAAAAAAAVVCAALPAWVLLVTSQLLALCVAALRGCCALWDERLGATTVRALDAGRARPIGRTSIHHAPHDMPRGLEGFEALQLPQNGRVIHALPLLTPRRRQANVLVWAPPLASLGLALKLALLLLGNLGGIVARGLSGGLSQPTEALYRVAQEPLGMKRVLLCTRFVLFLRGFLCRRLPPGKVHLVYRGKYQI